MKKSAKRKGFFRIVFMTLILVVMLAFMLTRVMEVIVHYKKDVVVPDLTGKTIYEVLNITSSLPLGIKKIGEEYNSEYPPYTVVKQVPAPGVVVKEGRIIKLILSRGGEKIVVPDVIGKQLAVAELEIKREGLLIGEETYAYSLYYGENLVCRQEPSPGKYVDKESFVNLVISMGPPPENVTLVPDFIGKDRATAEAWAAEKQIRVDVSVQSKPGVGKNIVVDQSPPPDTQIKPSETLKITVAE
jgi:beta-lactam-binding protein with PASTA domain